MRTDAEISAARILALGLAGPPERDPLEVVTHLLCLQGQMLGGALASVALRSATRDPAAVAAAVNEGALVRSWTQRGTIHLVASRDVGWILDLTAERMLRAAARRRADLGIDDRLIERADSLITDLISGQGPTTRAAVLQALEPVGVAEVPGRGYHVIAELAMRQRIVQGPLANGSSTEQLFVLCDDWISRPRRYPRERALAELVTRYACSHGPATVADAVRWTGLTTADVRAGIAAAEPGAIATTEVDGIEYLHAPELPDLLAAHRDQAQQLFLLPGFDELILGYKDRSATLAARDEQLVVPGKNGMFANTIVHRTRALATWRKARRRSGPPIEINPFPGRRVNRRAAERAARVYPAL